MGDRYTGKTSIYLSLLLHCNYLSLLGLIDGLGTKRIFGIYIGISWIGILHSELGLLSSLSINSIVTLLKSSNLSIINSFLFLPLYC